MVPIKIHNSITSLTIFILTFFISSVLKKYDTRFENVCKTNGYVTRLSALAGALYPRPEAEAMMRYTNSIMHIYYFLVSGPMDDEKWDKLLIRGMLTEEEIKQLKAQGSPGVVLYSWCVDIMKMGGHRDSGVEIEGALTQVYETFSGGCGLFRLCFSVNAILTCICVVKRRNMWAQGQLPLQLNMDECIGGTRGLAAKQIAYTLQQVPQLYFHAVYLTVHGYLIASCMDAGHTFGIAMNTSCRDLAEVSAVRACSAFLIPHLNTSHAHSFSACLLGP